MRKLKHFLLAASLSLSAQVTYAASLGALTVLSNIGQPLHAEIEIISAGEQELASLSAKLASAAVFAEQSVQLSPELGSLQLHVDTRPDGQPVLRLSTHEAITSPSLDLLIDMSWDAGSLVKKYAVPLEAAPTEDAEEDVALPALMEELPNEEALLAEANINDQTREVAAAQLTANAAALPDYTVEKGDTLRNIAVQKSVDGTSLEQLLIGLHRANPHAFVKGDINRLKTGVILHTPSTDEIRAINQLEAEREVRMHAKNWNIYRNKLAAAAVEAAPSSDDQMAAPSVSGKIDSVQDQATASGPRDVVKLSGGDASQADKSEQSKSQLEEELVARDKALQESNERIALLEKQLQDANKLLELRKQQPAPAAAPEAAKPAKPATPVSGQSWLTTVQEQLQKHPAWAPVGVVVALLLLVLTLLVRFFRKNKDADSAAEIPAAMSESAVSVTVPLVEEIAPPASQPVPEALLPIEDIASIMSEPVAEVTPSPELELESVPVFGSGTVLDIDDIAALMPEPAPEPVLEETIAELPEPELPAVAEDSQDAASLIAAMEKASAAGMLESASGPQVEETPSAPEETTSAFDADDVFANETAFAEPEVSAPVATEVEAPVAEAVEAVPEVAQEAVADLEPFDIDDVFAESATTTVAEEPAAEAEPLVEAAAQKDAAFDIEDVFDSEDALAAFAAEAAEHPPATAEEIAAAAMADEAATDVMEIEAGEVTAEDQFALDDMFDEAATAAQPETEPEPEAPVAAASVAEPKSDDHSAALSAAFDESAVADLSDLDFGFDIDLGDLAPKAVAKPVAAEKIPALDFSNINLNVAGDAAADDSAADGAESPEVDTKLDLVTAYIDMSDEEGARELLQEVLKEGGSKQIARAQKMLEDLG